MQYLEYTFTKNVFLVYLKFKFSWMTWIVSGNLTSASELLGDCPYHYLSAAISNLVLCMCSVGF